jgi:hypothetical protein
MKRKFYIFCVMVLCALLASLFYMYFEYLMIKIYGSYPSGSAPILTLAIIFILIAGIFGGFFLGRTWWRIVYIDHSYKNWKWKK